MSQYKPDSSSCFTLKTLVREPTIALPKIEIEEVSLKQKIERKVKSILRIPSLSTEPTTATQVSVGFSITNITQKDILLSLFNTYRPQILTSDNKVLDAGYSAISNLKRFKSSICEIAAGATHIVFPNLKLVQGRNSLFLIMNERSRAGWSIDALQIGTHQIRFIYENYQDELSVFERDNSRSFQIKNIWVGHFTTPYLEITIARDA